MELLHSTLLLCDDDKGIRASLPAAERVHLGYFQTNASSKRFLNLGIRAHIKVCLPHDKCDLLLAENYVLFGTECTIARVRHHQLMAIVPEWLRLALVAQLPNSYRSSD